MSNVATVSFKLPPDHYAVLRALADHLGTSVSELCRTTVTEAHDLDGKVSAFGSFLSGTVRNPDTQPHRIVAESRPAYEVKGE